MDNHTNKIEPWNTKVDMPSMGPGADTAKWWVEYLHECMLLGKYEAVLQYLSYARRSGAMKDICKAKEEMNRKLSRQIKTPLRPISGEYEICSTDARPGIQKRPAPMKSEPYFFNTKAG